MELKDKLDKINEDYLKEFANDEIQKLKSRIKELESYLKKIIRALTCLSICLSFSLETLNQIGMGMGILINGQGSVKASIRICAAHMQRQRQHIL